MNGDTTTAVQNILAHGQPRQDGFKRLIHLKGVGWVEQYRLSGGVFLNLQGGHQERLTGPLKAAVLERMPQ